MVDWKNPRLVFVCSGNICRSPMAAELARLALVARGVSPLVISMGTIARPGLAAEPHAISVIAERGGDISSHRSQALNSFMLNRADFVFGMTELHLASIEQVGPEARRAARLLARYAPEPLEAIWDPIGGTLDDFRESRDLIEVCVARWLEREGPAAT